MPALNANIGAFNSCRITEVTQFAFCNLYDMYILFLPKLWQHYTKQTELLLIVLLDMCTFYQPSTFGLLMSKDFLFPSANTGKSTSKGMIEFLGHLCFLAPHYLLSVFSASSNLTSKCSLWDHGS